MSDLGHCLRVRLNVSFICSDVGLKNFESAQLFCFSHR